MELKVYWRFNWLDRVEELERSLTTMKEQQSHLKEQLRLEGERKKELKHELENDHQRIVELERLLKDKKRSRCKSLEPSNSVDKGNKTYKKNNLIQLKLNLKWKN